jgi:hypothetical protein
MTVTELIAQAQDAGLTLTRAADGTLRIRGPRTCRQLAQALIERKAEVLAEIGADPRAQFMTTVVAPGRGYTTAPCPVCGFPTVAETGGQPTTCTRCIGQAVLQAYIDWRDS